MKNKFLFAAILGLTLAGCTKTQELYRRDEYNNPNFDANYYTKWDGIDELQTNTVLGSYESLKSTIDKGVVDLKHNGYDFNPEKYVWRNDFDHSQEFGYNNNLSKSDLNKEFRYGMTSKLFDGRIWCDGLYQLSRVQVNSTGFAMKFPKYLVNCQYLGFSARGGTTYTNEEKEENPSVNRTSIRIDVTWSFYRKTTEQDLYTKVEFRLEDIPMAVDNNGITSFVSFMPYFDDDFELQLNGAEAMSFEWKLHDELPDLSDDFNNKEKEHHMALMLYEIFIGESTWR